MNLNYRLLKHFSYFSVPSTCSSSSYPPTCDAILLVETNAISTSSRRVQFGMEIHGSGVFCENKSKICIPKSVSTK